jgi:hypothetical protein
MKNDYLEPQGTKQNEQADGGLRWLNLQHKPLPISPNFAEHRQGQGLRTYRPNLDGFLQDGLCEQRKYIIKTGPPMGRQVVVDVISGSI